MTKLSIYFPTHNRIEWLKESIISIEDSNVDYELLIVANGCTDGTNDYLAGYNNPKLRYWIEPENLRGRYRFLAEQATGEYHLCGSDDDIQMHGGLRAKLSMLDSHSKLGLVFSTCRGMDSTGSDQGVLGMGAISREILTTGALDFRKIILGCYIPAPTCVFRAEVFRPWLHWLDEKGVPLVDWQLWLEAANAGVDAGFLNWPTLRYRQHDRSDSHHYTTSGRYTRDHIKMWEHWAERGYSPTTSERRDLQLFVASLAHGGHQDLRGALSELETALAAQPPVTHV